MRVCCGVFVCTCPGCVMHCLTQKTFVQTCFFTCTCPMTKRTLRFLKINLQKVFWYPSGALVTTVEGRSSGAPGPPGGASGSGGGRGRPQRGRARLQWRRAAPGTCWSQLCVGHIEWQSTSPRDERPSQTGGANPNLDATQSFDLFCTATACTRENSLVRCARPSCLCNRLRHRPRKLTLQRVSSRVGHLGLLLLSQNRGHLRQHVIFASI